LSVPDILAQTNPLALFGLCRPQADATFSERRAQSLFLVNFERLVMAAPYSFNEVSIAQDPSKPNLKQA
tara:strand:- start:374 stop:580 length:207 start_codon:yes stop_codon:yes gene_type:complete